MWDDGWPDALRRGAARALWEHGGSAERLEALRGLALLESAEDVGFLHGLLAGPPLEEALRDAALEALTSIPSPEAARVLVALAEDTSSPGFRRELFFHAGRLPWEEIGPFLTLLLRNPETPASHREAMAEGLVHAPAEAQELLLEVLQTDPEPSVREQAAWALSGRIWEDTESPAHLPDVVALSRAEEDETVRRRIYELAWTLPHIPAEDWEAQIYAEQVPSTQVAAWNALAVAVAQKDRDAELVGRFEEKAVPALLAIAQESGDLNLQMRAVFALRRAQTPASNEALRKISTLSATPSIALAAAHGLSTPTTNPNP